MRAGRPGFALALGIAIAAGPSLLAGAATGVPAAETARPPFSPAPRNCFSLRGFSLRTPRLTDAVHLADDGSATIAWITPGGVVMSAHEDRSGVWGVPEAVAGASPVDSRAPVLAGDAAGDLALAWVRGDAVQVALRPAGGSWGRPRTISRARQEVIGFSAIPLVSVAAGGQVAVAWPSIGRSHIRHLAGGGLAISGAMHLELALGSISARVRIARPLILDAPRFDGHLVDPQTAALGMTSSGRPAVAFSDGRRVIVTDIDPATGAPMPDTTRRLVAPAPRRPSGRPGSYTGAVLSSGASGRMAVAWTANGVVSVAVRSRAGTWGRVANVSRPPAVAGDPQIAVGGDGRVAATWVASIRTPVITRHGGRSPVAFSALRSVVGVWDTPQRLTSISQIPSDPHISIDGAGRTIVVLALGTNGISGVASKVLFVSRGPADATWTDGGGLSTAGIGPLFPRLATNTPGDAIAVWSRCVTRTSATVEVTTRRAGASAWSPVVRFSAP